MKKLLSNVWVNLLFIVSLTVAAMIFALYDSYEIVLETISTLDPLKLLLIIGLGLLPYLTWGYIITILARTIDKKFKYKHGAINAFIGGFMSGITPSSTGGQFAQAYALRKRGLKTSQAAGLISIDFFIYQIAVVITAITMYIIFLGTADHAAISLVFGVGLIMNSFVVFLLWIMVSFPKLYHKISFWGIHLLHKMRFIKNKEKILEEWNKTLIHFNSAIEEVTQNKAVFWKVTGLHFLKLMLYYSTPFMIGTILGIQLSFDDFFPMLALGSFITISNTFVPLPGSSGVTEGLFVLAFSTIMGKGAASSTMILWRFANFYIPVLTGGYMFIRLRNINPFKSIKTSDLLNENDE